MATKRPRKAPKPRTAAPAKPRPAQWAPKRKLPPPPTLQQELASLARGGARSLRRGLVVMLCLGVVAALAFGAWSALPRPAYSSEDLSVGSPFDLTFKVVNESEWFPLSNLSIRCIVDHIRASGLPPTMVEATDVRFPSRQMPSLEPGEAATFTCPFRALIGHPINSDPDIVRRSEIHFRATYDLPLWRSFRMTDNGAPLFFDTRVLPPRWIIKPQG